MQQEENETTMLPDRKGSLGLTVLALVLGAVLAIVVGFVAHAWIAAAHEGRSDDWIASQVFAVVAFVGALIAVSGLIMRAAAHNKPDEKNQDYLGKLFAASTAGFVVVAAEQKMDHAIFYTVTGITVAVALFTLATCLKVLRWRKDRDDSHSRSHYL